MASDRTQRFIDALQALEADSDLEPMAAVFAEQAELANLTTRDDGPDAARRFWSRYRAQFDEVRSEFSRVIEAGDDAVLVWRTSGRLRAGAPIDYRGVSLLAFDGERVQGFDTCYDSAAFMQPAARANEAAAQ